jgi:hypothetical protein
MPPDTDAVVPVVLSGYASEAAHLLDERVEARVLWHKVDYALQTVRDDRYLLDQLLDFVRTAEGRWRAALSLDS